MTAQADADSLAHTIGEIRRDSGKAQLDAAFVERVEDRLGMGHAAWDTIAPIRICEAVREELKMQSLGQVAYEAYCEHTGWKSLISGADLPQWVDLKPEIQDAWNAAANAVARKIGPS